MGSVVVDDFDLVRMTFSPDKANSPLIVDADRVLALAFTAGRFKTISRRHAEIVEPLRIVQQT
jgi:hypothetical protein